MASSIEENARKALQEAVSGPWHAIPFDGLTLVGNHKIIVDDLGDIASENLRLIVKAPEYIAGLLEIVDEQRELLAKQGDTDGT